MILFAGCYLLIAYCTATLIPGQGSAPLPDHELLAALKDAGITQQKAGEIPIGTIAEALAEQGRDKSYSLLENSGKKPMIGTIIAQESAPLPDQLLAALQDAGITKRKAGEIPIGTIEEALAEQGPDKSYSLLENSGKKPIIGTIASFMLAEDLAENGLDKNSNLLAKSGKGPITSTISLENGPAGLAYFHKEFSEGETTVDLAARSDLDIISSNGVIGPSPCAKTCAGTTGRSSTPWTGTSGIYVSTYVDISGCGFTDTPIITTSVEGNDWHTVASGTSSVVNASKNGFHIFVWGWVAYFRNNPDGPIDAFVKTQKWNVNWSAFGFVC